MSERGLHWIFFGLHIDISEVDWGICLVLSYVATTNLLWGSLFTWFFHIGPRCCPSLYRRHKSRQFYPGNGKRVRRWCISSITNFLCYYWRIKKFRCGHRPICRVTRALLVSKWPDICQTNNPWNLFIFSSSFISGNPASTNNTIKLVCFFTYFPLMRSSLLFVFTVINSFMDFNHGHSPLRLTAWGRLELRIETDFATHTFASLLPLFSNISYALDASLSAQRWFVLCSLVYATFLESQPVDWDLRLLKLILYCDIYLFT